MKDLAGRTVPLERLGRFLLCQPLELGVPLGNILFAQRHIVRLRLSSGTLSTKLF